MDSLHCEICKLDFNDKTRIPKFMKCGHTICIICLEITINNNLLCPECRACISETVDSHPTNFILLDLIRDWKLSQTSSTNCVEISKISSLKSKIKSTKAEMEKNKNKLSSCIQLAQRNLDRINIIMNNSNDMDLHNMEKTINTIDEQYKKYNLTQVEFYKNWKTTISPTLKMNNTENAAAYKKQVYEHLVNDEAVFIMAFVGDNLRYGKVTIRDNLILIHPLELSSIPDCAITLWLSDIKQLSFSQKIHAFLKISYGNLGLQHFAFIKLVNTFEAMQFMKLCTGEYGVSYKGIKVVVVELKLVKYKYSPIFWLNFPGEISQEFTPYGSSDYNYFSDDDESGDEDDGTDDDENGDCNLQMIGNPLNKVFLVYSSGEHKLCDAFGKVNNSVDLVKLVFDINTKCWNINEIVDCGICFEM